MDLKKDITLFPDSEEYDLLEHEILDWPSFEEFRKLKVAEFQIPEYQFPRIDNVPACCRSCNNSPVNGGSGVCFCTLPYNLEGIPDIASWVDWKS